MTEKQKEILDEMIFFIENNWKTIKYLKKIELKMNKRLINSSIRLIFSWTKYSIDEIYPKDKLDLKKNLIQIDIYKIFFEEFPEISEVFSLNEGYIGWRESLNEKERDEIRKYIDDNYKPKRRTTIRRR